MQKLNIIISTMLVILLSCGLYAPVFAESVIIRSGDNQTAAEVGFTPTGNITATNVQSAIAENDTKKIPHAEFTAADEIMVGTGAGTHGQVTLAASEFLAKKAAGGVTNVSAADARTILNVADGADVTGDNAPKAHATSHTDGTDDIQSATNAQKGLATAAQITALELATDVSTYADSPQVVTGGDITVGTNAGTFKVSAVTALLRTTDSYTGALTYVTLAEQDNQAITSPNITYFVMLDYNAGTPQIVLATANAYEAGTDKTQIPIGKVMKDSSNNVHFISGGYSFQDGVRKLQRRIRDLHNFTLASGATIEYSGTNNFIMSQGTVYGGVNRFVLSAYNSATTTFIPLYDDGTHTAWTEGTPRNTIDFTHYDDLDGTLGTVGNNKYGTHWVYQHIDDGDVYVIYGRGSYSLAAAEAEAEPPKPTHLTDFGILIGKIVAPQAGGSFSLIQMITDTQFTAVNASDHGNLTGLDDDDHTQYVLADGTRDLEGGGLVAPAAITSFAGTISAATRTATFTETADYSLCKVGSTLIADGDTRIIMALLGSDQVTVDADTTWAGSTAITSLQDPVSQLKQDDGTVVGYVNALGGIGLLGGLNDLQKGLVLHDGDSGITLDTDNRLAFFTTNIRRWYMDESFLAANNATGGALMNEASTSTNPTVVPNRSFVTSGVGYVGTNQPNIIAGGVEAIRSIEANSIIYNVLNAVQQDSVTDATSNGTTTITKAGENFNTTCIVGDSILIFGGTTTADYGVYSIATVTDDENLVLDRALSGSVADMDFYVFRGGTITTGSDLYVGNKVKITHDGTDGVISTTAGDLVLNPAGNDVVLPSYTSVLYLRKSDIRLEYTGFSSNTSSFVQFANSGVGGVGTTGVFHIYNLSADVSAGDAFTINSGAGDELTDTDGEQSMVYIEPKINQSSTASYNALKIDVTETALGDGSTGDGNNLLNLQVASTTKARINNVGSLFLGDQAAASADVAAFGQVWVANTTPNELWFTDDAGTDTQLSSHPMDAPPELYTNVPGQDFIGVKRHKLLGIIQWQTLDGVITEETFAAYNLRRKDVPGHTDLVQIDYTEWVDKHKESLKQKFIKENITEVEVLKADAFEMEDVEEKVLYITEIQTQEEYEEEIETIVDGEPVIEKVKKIRPVMKIKKQPNKIGEKISYKLEGEEVVEVKEPIYEMKIVQKSKIKDGIRFDETDGKFYKKVKPTKEQVDDAVKDFEPEIPEWIKTRLAA